MSSYTIWFENGKAYSDRSIVLDDVCQWCQLKEIPRGSDGQILVRFILISSPRGSSAHYEACQEVCK